MPLPENIRVARNKAIRLAFLEVACCILSFGFYEVRRARIILVLLVFNCIFTAIGFYAKLLLSLCGLLVNACYCVSVIGGFYIYIMIDYMIRGEEKSINRENTGISITWMLLITSLPVLGLFLMGVYSCYLAIILDEELDQRKKSRRQRGEVVKEAAAPRRDNDYQAAASTVSAPRRQAPKLDQTVHQEHTIEVLDIRGQEPGDPSCVICLDREKDAAFYPCGHQCLCHECGDRFLKEAKF